MTPSGKTRPARLATGVLALPALLFLAACAKSLPQDTLSPDGPIAKDQAGLFWLVTWIAIAVFILVEGLLVVAMWKFRHRPGRGVPTQIHGNRRLEIAWTLAPALILAGIAVPTVGTIFSLAARPAGNVLEVTVTGHQWWWEVEYPDLDVITANEIHIPINRPVRVSITSKDVIHSFWVPRLAGKQDLEPGRTNHLNIEATRVGVYLGQCAEFCGASHANMRFRVFADSAEDFQAWAEQQKAAPVDPAQGSPEAEGADLFANGKFAGGFQCVACHSVDPTVTGTIGPNLAHFAGRTTFAGAILDNDTESLRRWLDDPPALKPGADMPDLGLTRPQIDALIAYLQNLE
jgi:cytochrome c oxidase subunit II